MRPEQIALVQGSFEYLRPLTETVAKLFYLRLFEAAPGLRPLFKGNMKEQAHKLMQMLGYVVNGLHAPERILTELQELGQRHVAYGVQHEHYCAVREALLWTLDRALDEDFTPELEAAWRAAYEMIAEAMRSGNAQSANPDLQRLSHLK